MEFPVKRLQNLVPNYSTDISRIVNVYKGRIDIDTSILSNSNFDAPCYSKAVDLGRENNGDTSVYKVNVPGYFYRASVTTGYDSRGKSGVLLTSDPNNLTSDPNNITSSASRMAYMVGSNASGSIGNGNNMFPILPGAHTYAYIVRGSNDYGKNWYFIPTVFGACLNIADTDLLLKVGNVSAISDISGYASNMASIFEGEWNTNWISICGYNVKRSSAVKLITGYDLAAARRTWMLNIDTILKPEPSDYDLDTGLKASFG